MTRLLLALFTCCALSLFAQPPNDSCLVAQPLAMTLGDCQWVIGENTDASDSDGQPDPTCANYQGSDVWFSFVAPTSGETIVETQSTDSLNDTGMAVYSGDCNDLTQLACDDDGGDGFFSLISLDGLNAGETYYVRIWAYNNQATGTFEICASEPAPAFPPEYDDCATAALVEVGGPLECTPSVFTNVGASSSTDDPAPACANYDGTDVWLQLIVPASGEFTIETSPDESNIDTGMAVYSGECDNLTEIACNDDGGQGLYSLIEFEGLTAGETLFVRIWEYGGDFENSFSFCAYEPSLCEDISALVVDSIALDFLSLNWTTNNLSASYAIEYGPQGFNQGDGTVLTGTIDGDHPPVGIENLDAGIAYDFYLTETCMQNMPSNTIQGTFFTDFNPSPNDLCTSAITLEVGGPEECIPLTFTNGGATDSGALPAPGCANYFGADVWFEFTVPTNGIVFIETFADIGLNDLGMAAYSGSCDELVLLDCDDDDGQNLFSYIELTGLSPGESIFVRVWDYNGNDVGSFQLCAYEPDLCNPIDEFAAELVLDESIILSWQSINASASYVLEYGPAGFEIGTGTLIMGNTGIDGPPIEIDALDPSTTYDFYLYENCLDGMLTETLLVSYATNGPPPTNDDLCNAIPIIVNAPEVSMNSNGATSEENEVAGSCWFFASTEINSVWASFVAPVAESVIVSTDYIGNELNDTHITIYSLDGDCSELIGLTEIGCDEDGGIVGTPSYASIAVLDDLAPGETYYIQIDGFNEFSGQFFLSVNATVVSLLELEKLDLEIYPNPTEDLIRINAAHFGELIDIEVIDLKGKTVLSEQNLRSANELTVNLSAFESGLYLLHLIGEKGWAVEPLIVK